MNKHDIAKAKDPDLRASMAAMRRAARLAREIAIQTDTSIVIVQDGQLLHVSADELRREIECAKITERLALENAEKEDNPSD